MKFRKLVSQSLKTLKAFAVSPQSSSVELLKVPPRVKATSFIRNYEDRELAALSGNENSSNPLREYFDNNTEGPGIWKWEHYFEMYHAHFQRFAGQREVNVLEIGIYSGGSLGMWRSYFGEGCHVYGVDIEEACKSYENDYTTVFIGDQEDREFWRRFRENTPPIDIVIDDGGHRAEQQLVTLEETLPYMRQGGVYLCEDISNRNYFAAYASRLTEGLNLWGTPTNSRNLSGLFISTPIALSSKSLEKSGKDFLL